MSPFSRSARFALASVFALQTVFLSHAYADQPTFTNRDCAADLSRLVLKGEDVTTFYRFNTALSWLQPKYGKPSFDSSLRNIIQTQFGGQPLEKMNPILFERLENLVNQQKLRNLVAKTIRLRHPTWANFDWHMTNLTFNKTVSWNVLRPFEKSATDLIQALESAKNEVKNQDRREFVEAVVSAAEMYLYLQKRIEFNRELMGQEADQTAKTVATAAVGAVGLTLLYSTLIFAAPVVGVAGVVSARLATNAALSLRLAKLGEIAAGGGIGVVGASGARLGVDSYLTISEAWKQSLNKNTSYACELGNHIEAWKSVALKNTADAALLGLGMGIGGGLLTLNERAARGLLWTTWKIVLVVQGYTAGKAVYKAAESLLYFKYAEWAAAEGNAELSSQYLVRARDLAQLSGEKALEAIIIGTLTHHVGHNYREAMTEGSSAIRKLYAASADTIPTAGHVAVEIFNGGGKH